MYLEQMAMFGVRGERIRIKKTAPIAAVPTRAETMIWKCLACGHTWRDLRECKGVCRAGCPACRSLNILDCNLGPAEAGEATGCGLAVLLAAAIACLALAWAIDRRGAHVRVSWIAEYPDPVCERCGKVLDGKINECSEEGKAE